jgi:hypothetical protein
LAEHAVTEKEENVRHGPTFRTLRRRRRRRIPERMTRKNSLCHTTILILEIPSCSFGEAAEARKGERISALCGEPVWLCNGHGRMSSRTRKSSDDTIETPWLPGPGKERVSERESHGSVCLSADGEEKNEPENQMQLLFFTCIFWKQKKVEHIFR